MDVPKVHKTEIVATANKTSTKPSRKAKGTEDTQKKLSEHKNEVNDEINLSQALPAPAAQLQVKNERTPRGTCTPHKKQIKEALGARRGSVISDSVIRASVSTREPSGSKSADYYCMTLRKKK